MEKDSVKGQVGGWRERDEQHDERGGGGRTMAIFDLFLNYNNIGMEPDITARYEEKLQEANVGRDLEDLEVKISLWRQEIPACHM